jgi:O-methyltransferase
MLGPWRTAQFVAKRMRSPNPIRLWEIDPDFLSLARHIGDYTLVDHRRLFMLYQFAQQARSVPGEVAEIGVYRGGTAKLIAELCAPKTVHLFDTFEGMPAVHAEHDFHRERDFGDAQLEDVKRYLAENTNVVFHPGFFPDTATPVQDKRFCLVHIDVDVYPSVKSCCEFFYPRTSSGGTLLFDDYGFVTCPGAKVAVDEFFAGKPEKPTYLPSGQCVVTRLAC